MVLRFPSEWANSSFKGDSHCTFFCNKGRNFPRYLQALMQTFLLRKPITTLPLFSFFSFPKREGKMQKVFTVSTLLLSMLCLPRVTSTTITVSFSSEILFLYFFSYYCDNSSGGRSLARSLFWTGKNVSLLASPFIIQI